MRHLSVSDIVVTTTYTPSDEAVAGALALAHRLHRPFVTRRKDSIAALARREGVAAAVVVSDNGTRLVHRGRSYGFHPSMAWPRLAALQAGGRDRLVQVARLQPGDRVLDCTCGLCADAIVAAHAVGDGGSVDAVESSPILAAIVLDGTQRYHHTDSALVRAMRRVRVMWATYESLLPSLPAQSLDVVYFDPMFKATIHTAKSLDLVRMLASTGTLSREVVNDARRVARRSVVVKDRAPGPLLRALGVPVVSQTQRVWYGRLDAS